MARTDARPRSDAAAVTGAPRWASNLPWIDGFAALSAGVLVLVLRGPLAGLHGVSVELLTVVGVVNVLYSGFGLTLGTLRRRPTWLLTALVFANLAWAALCVTLAAGLPAAATPWAYAHLLGEATFVAALALLEWRYRRTILGRPKPARGAR